MSDEIIEVETVLENGKIVWQRIPFWCPKCDKIHYVLATDKGSFVQDESKEWRLFCDG